MTNPTAEAARRAAEMHEPVEVFPLAQFICEEMEARGWTTHDVALRMIGPYQRNRLVVDMILAVHKDGLLIDDDTFQQLSRAFGVHEQFFRNLDDTWRKWPDRRVPYEPPESVFGEGRNLATELDKDTADE